MCLYFCECKPHMYGCQWKLEEGIQDHGIDSTGGCELPVMGPENQSWILCQVQQVPLTA